MLNRDGFSLMHLASMNGGTELVLRLLKIDKDLGRVKGREGMTPFHYVVATRNSRLLVEFLEACPCCIEDVTVRDETALHRALTKDQIEAFNLLIGWLQRTHHTHGSIFAFKRKLVDRKDNDNNNVLHIAAMNRQHEALKLLLESHRWLDVKAKELGRFDGSNEKG
ncbi:ankyrin repeat-containing protein BDA1-like [Hibiscus syriacus]|uniref:ankyrin repeat-containing protein BDA1-like n=1 Tax=Hibiscus syriacus TaxID=106335 RepID=UPI001924E32F|nr:ankyrin repeat-containing protein BDA1-like [Hibiscus syriacus]